MPETLRLTQENVLKAGPSFHKRWMEMADALVDDALSRLLFPDCVG